MAAFTKRRGGHAFGTIRGRSVVASLLLLALLATVALLAVLRTNADRNTHQSIEAKTAIAADLQDARAQFYSAGMSFVASSLAENRQPLSDSYYNAVNSGQSLLQTARISLEKEGDPSLIGMLDGAQEQANQVVALIDSFAADPQADSHTAVSEYLPRLLPLANSLIDNLAQIAQAEQEAVATDVAGANKQADVSLWLTVIFGTAGCLLAVGVLVGFLRSVVTPLGSLQRSVRAVASGDMESRAKVSGPAEVASLAADFNEMVAQLKGVTEQMRQRLKVESAVARASTVLATAESYDGALNTALRILGEAVDIEHAYIFIFNGGKTRMDNTHEWNVPGRKPTRDRFQALDCATYPWWVGKLTRNEDIVLHDLHQLPAEAEAERELLQAMRVRSVVAVPFGGNGDLAGFVGFGDTRGSHIWHDQDVRLLRLASESIASFIERKRAERALRESDERYRGMFESSPDAVYVLDLEGHVLEANESATQLLGYSMEDMRGRPFTKLWVEDYSQTMAALAEELKTKGRQSEPLVFKLRRKDGSVAEVETLVAVIRKDGKATAFQGIARDVTERRHAEEALRESEERFRSLSAAAPIGIFLTDTDGGSVYINKRMLAICGLTLEESLGLGWLNVLHPDDHERVMSSKQRANAQNDEFSQDFRIVTPQGETRWVSVRSTPVGTLGSRVGTLEDITDRKEAEDALRQSEERFRSLGASAPIGIFQSDAWGKVVFVNDRFSEIAGLSFLDEPDRDWFSVIHPEDREAVISGVIEAIKNRVEFATELRILTPEGATRWAYGRARDMRSEEGRFMGLVGMIEDISERREAEDALRESEERFRSLSASAPVGIFLTDAEDRVTYINECLRGIIGRGQVTSADDALNAVVHPDDRNKLRQAHLEAAEHEVYEFLREFRVITPRGETRWVRTHVMPILSREGKTNGLVGTVEDITEHRSLEEERQNAYEKTTLLLALAAEARDPYTEHHLFRIRGYSEAIALQLRLSPETAKEIGLAALLHDLGKTRVPDAILTKPGPLTEDEWQIMRQHTIWGEKLLPRDPWFETARQITRSHHENWDGTGYPDGLAGEKIPLAATIVAVADGFDAMTSRRPYKGPWPPHRAMRELRATKGTRYSPEAVEAFERAVAAGEIARIASVQRSSLSALMKAA